MTVSLSLNAESDGRNDDDSCPVHALTHSLSICQFLMMVVVVLVGLNGLMVTGTETVSTGALVADSGGHGQCFRTKLLIGRTASQHSAHHHHH